MIDFTLKLPCPVGQVSDGYHTFDELYEHRCLLFCLAQRCTLKTWKSKKHDDGTEFEGWFIAGIDLPTGTISYHLPLSMWNLCPASEYPLAPKWDGHTPSDVCQRIKKYLEGIR